MVFKRYIKRGNKIYGPYIYHNQKQNGKVVSTYLGKHKEEADTAQGSHNLSVKESSVNVREEKTKTNFPYKKLLLFFFISIALLACLFFITQTSLTGRVTVSVDGLYKDGNMLKGNLQLMLQQSELLPTDSKIIINSAGSEYIYNLSDLILETPIEGDYYLKDREISGSGLGYGTESRFPVVSFILGIYNEQEESGETYTLPENETINETSPEPVESETLPPENEEINETEETLPEPESSETGDTRTITGQAIGILSNFFSFFSGHVTLELVEEIEASVTANSSYVYNLSNREIAQIISSSQAVELEIQENEAIVTTDYTGDEILLLDINVDDLSIPADNEIIVSIVYNDEELMSATKSLISDETEELPSEPEENVSIITTREKIVLGKPVKWMKNVDLSSPQQVIVQLPSEAENITVKNLEKSQRYISSDSEFEINTDEDGKEVILDENATAYSIEYYTDAPEAFEQDTSYGKKVVISGPSDLGYSDILSFASIPEKVFVGEESMIKIKWVENDSYLPFTAYDLDGNGMLDYVEWVTEHLSSQTFEIILITKAEHLDENRIFVEDVYEIVKERDGDYSEIPNGHYIRVTFEIPLNNGRDITFYARSNSSAGVKVYEKDGTTEIADFGVISDDDEYKIYLDNLNEEQDTFDLLVYGNENASVEFDYIVDPAYKTWVNTTTSGAPVARYEHTVVWDGVDRLVVWGGYNSVGGYINSGSRYNKTANTWSATTTSGAPVARSNHVAVLIGDRMVVWGGASSEGLGYSSTGGRYNITANTWAATNTTNAPSGRYLHTGVSTGTEMIVWGGIGEWNEYFNTGSRYNPTTNIWNNTTTTSAPTARAGHTAVWTGTEMIIWGGYNSGGANLNTGSRYNPVTNVWNATTTSGAPTARRYHTAVWNGTHMIVWGGYTSTAQNTGSAYNPATNTWTTITTTGAPAARYWTPMASYNGELIIWGGYDSGVYSNGGHYNYLTNTWTATNNTGAPAGRYNGQSNNIMVPTSDSVIIWGGPDGINGWTNTGGIYYLEQASPYLTLNINSPASNYPNYTYNTTFELNASLAAVGGSFTSCNVTIYPGALSVSESNIVDFGTISSGTANSTIWTIDTTDASNLYGKNYTINVSGNCAENNTGNVSRIVTVNFTWIVDPHFVNQSYNGNTYYVGDFITYEINVTRNGVPFNPYNFSVNLTDDNLNFLAFQDINDTINVSDGMYYGEFDTLGFTPGIDVRFRTDVFNDVGGMLTYQNQADNNIDAPTEANLSLGSSNLNFSTSSSSNHTVRDLVINNSNAIINWSDTRLNLSRNTYDLGEVINLSNRFVYVNSNVYPEFNQSTSELFAPFSAEITIKNVSCYGYKIHFSGNPADTDYDSVISNGVVCPENICSSISCANNELRFNVNRFTGYAVGGNSNLTIWDEADSGMLYGGQTKYNDETVNFFANYTNLTSGEGITDATCMANFADSTNNAMIWNSTDSIYVYNRTFSSAGDYDWNVTCNKTGFENLTATDNITINETVVECDVYLDACKTSGWVANTKYCLNQTIGPAATTCMTITASNVTLNCQNFMMYGDNGTSDYGIFNNAGYDNITIKNCWIQDFGTGIYFTHASLYSENNLFENVTVYDNGANGIWAVRVLNSTFRNIIGNSTAAQDQQYDINFQYSANNTIRDSWFNLETTYAIYLQTASDDNKIINNTLNDQELYVNNAADRTLIENNTFNCSAFGLQVTCASAANQCYNTTIRHNYIKGIAQDGLTLSYANGGEIYNNTIDNPGTGTGDYGIVLISSTGLNIYNNTVNGSYDHGIYLTTAANNNNISNNTIINSGGDGIYLTSASDSNNFTKNIISSSNYGIHLIDSSHNILNSNNITSASFGLAIEADADSEFNISADLNNSFDGKYIYYETNKNNAVYDAWTNMTMAGCYHCNNVTYKNMFFDNENSPLIVLAGTNNSRLENLNVSNGGINIANKNGAIYQFDGINNTFLGLNVTNGSQVGTGILLRGNYTNITDSFVSNFSEGIFAYYSKGHNITNSTILANNLYGVELDHSELSVIENCTFNSTSAQEQNYDIYLYYSNNNLIRNCSFDLESTAATYFYYSDDNNLTDSDFHDEDAYVYYGCDRNIIENNNFTINTQAILFTCSSSSNQCYNNIVRHNYITGGTIDAVTFTYTNGTQMYNNTLENVGTGVGDDGMQLTSAWFNNIYNNTIDAPYAYGINLLTNSDKNIIENNTIINTRVNGDGLRLSGGSDSNNITGNNITNVSGYGVYITTTVCTNNIVWNNFFNNTNNAWDNSGGTNYWNITKTLGTNIYGGTYIGGNYWDDYTGVDNTGDGLGDTDLPYTSGGAIASGGDYLPLVQSFVSPEPPVIAELFVNSTNGNNLTNESLTCYVNATDINQDNVTYAGYWYKNGAEDLAFNTSPLNFTPSILVNVSTLLFGNTTKGENWACNVTAYDIYNTSDSNMSANLTILNAAPTHTTPFMNASSVLNKSSDNFTVYNQSTADIDADTIKNIINWKINDTSLTNLLVPFEGGSNSTFTKDYSGFGNNGTVVLNGTAQWNSTGGYDGKGAYEFDGDGDYINVPATILSNEQTVVFWMKVTSCASGSCIPVSSLKWTNPDHDGFRFTTNSNALVLGIWTNSSDNPSVSVPITYGNWYHVAGTWSNLTGELKLYLNGSLVDNDSFSYFDTFPSDLDIGRYNYQDNNYFNGTIDEVRVWNRTLSAEQINALYMNRTDLIIGAQELQEGDLLEACITPNDGANDGLELCSNTVYSTEPTLATYVTIWDGTDAAGGSNRVYEFANTTYYANYTNLSGEVIPGGDCFISFDDEIDSSMTWNATSELYEYIKAITVQNISIANATPWNVTCSKSGYDAAFDNDTARIYPIWINFSDCYSADANYAYSDSVPNYSYVLVGVDSHGDHVDWVRTCRLLHNLSFNSNSCYKKDKNYGYADLVSGTWFWITYGTPNIRYSGLGFESHGDRVDWFHSCYMPDLVANLSNCCSPADNNYGCNDSNPGTNFAVLGADTHGDAVDFVHACELVLNETQSPTVDLISPDDNAGYNLTANPITFNCSATGQSLKNITFSIWDNGTLLYNSTANKTGTYNYSAFNYTPSAQGVFTWSCSANDNLLGNGFSAENRTIIVYNGTGPEISLLSPEYGATKIFTNITFIFYATTYGGGTLDCSLILDGNLMDVVATINQGRGYFSDVVDDGTHNWSVMCMDNVYRVGVSNTSIFTVNTSLNESDADNPTVQLMYPTNGRIWYYAPKNVTLLYNATDDYGDIFCTLYTNMSGDWEAYANHTYYPVAKNETINVLLEDLDYGTYLWNVWCNDSSGNNSFAPGNFTFNLIERVACACYNCSDCDEKINSPICANITLMDDISLTPANQTGHACMNKTNVLDEQARAFFGNGHTISSTQDQYGLGMVLGSGTPLEIFLVIDSSGSMAEDNKMEDAQAAARAFVNTILPDYKIGIVDFDSTGRVVANLTTTNSTLQNAINAMTAGGKTAVGEGINAALDKLEGNNKSKTIILMSDGKHNTGSSPYSAALRAANLNATIYSIGFGSGADANLLKQIAETTPGGDYYFAPNGTELRNIYLQIIDEHIRVDEHTIRDLNMTGFYRAINLLGVSDSVITNINTTSSPGLYGAMRPGLYIDGGENLSITNSSFPIDAQDIDNSNFTGINNTLQNVNHQMIDISAAENCTIFNNTGTAFRFTNLDNSNISYNNNTGNGVLTFVAIAYFGTGSSNDTYEYNTASDNAYSGADGIRVSDCRNCTIRHNIANNNSGNGISLLASTVEETPEGTTLENNTANYNLVGFNINYGYSTRMNDVITMRNNTALQNTKYSYYVDSLACKVDLDESNVGGDTGKPFKLIHDDSQTIQNANNYSGVEICRANHTIINNVTLYNPIATSDGIIILYGYNNSILNSNISRVYEGVYVYGGTTEGQNYSSNTSVINSVIEDNEDDGIQLHGYGMPYSIVYNNTIKNNSGSYGVYSASNYNNISRNIIYHSMTIASYHCLSGQGDNNNISDNLLYGQKPIALGTSYNLTFYNNTLNHTGSSSSLTSYYGNISYNNFRDSAGNSIAVHNGTVANNNFTNTTSAGLNLGASHDTNVTNNTVNIVNVGNGIIAIIGGGNIIANNTVTNVSGGTGGIGITSNNTVIGNNVTNISGYGIYFQGGADNCTIAFNNVLNATSGIYLIGSSSNYIQQNNISYNNLTNSSANSIYIYQYANYNNFTRNIINHNSLGYAIEAGFTGVGNNSIYDNLISNAQGYTVNDTSAGNSWNTTYNCSAGYTNIIGGNCIGGNYWSDYYLGQDDGSGDYPHNISGDGIGDTNIPWKGLFSILNGGDYLPLMNVSNSVPTQGIPLLNSTSGNNYSTDNLTCYNQSTADSDGDLVRNVINWYVNDTKVLLLNMPFTSGALLPNQTRDYASGNNGTINGTTFYVTGGYDGKEAYYFGGGDYINFSFINFTSSDRWSVSFWAKKDADGYAGRVIGNKDDNNNRIDISNNNVYFYNDTGQYATFINYNPDALWHFYVLSAYGNKIILYVDGVYKDSQTILTAFKINNIGRGYSTGTYDFQGYADEFKVWNRTLTYSQVEALYNNNTNKIISSGTNIGDIWQCEITPNDGKADGNSEKSNNLTVTIGDNFGFNYAILNSSLGMNSTIENLTAYVDYTDNVNKTYDWYMNSTPIMLLNLPFNVEANPARDYSGYNRQCDVFGATWARDNRSYSFVGGGQYINFSEINLSSDSNWSVSFRAQKDADGLNGRVIGNKDDNNNRIDISTNNVIFYNYTGGTITFANYNPDNLSHFYSITAYGANNSISLYVDGVLQDTKSIKPAFSVNAIGRGYANGQYDFRGIVDDVIIWNRSLTVEQIGILNSSINNVISSTETVIGETWTYNVTPNDGLDDGELQTSNDLLIGEPGNLPPVIEQIFVNSSSGNNYTEDDLTCWVNATDYNEDNITGYIGYWYLNGNETTQLINITDVNYTQGTLVNVSTFSSIEFNAGDNWSCNVSAYDGENYSAYVISENITLYESPNPVVNTVEVTPSEQGYNRTVTITANVTDPNDDLDIVLVGINASGTETNYSMTNVSEIYTYNYTTTYTRENVSIRIYANDSLGDLGTNNTTLSVTVNITLQIKTLLDDYGDYQWVNLTDPPGDSVWVNATYAGAVSTQSEAFAITADEDYVYVGGFGSDYQYGNMRIEKHYKKNGTLVTGFGTNGVIVYNPGGSGDYVRDLMVDSNGEYLYAVGYYESAPSNIDWRIIKYYINNGSEVWNIASNPSSHYDYAYAITQDEDYIFVGGNQDWDYDGPARVEKRLKTTGALASDFNSGVYTYQYSGAYGSDTIYDLEPYAGSIVFVATVDERAADTKWVVQRVTRDDLQLHWTSVSNPSSGADAARSLNFESGSDFFVGGTVPNATGPYRWRVEKRCAHAYVGACQGKLDTAFSGDGIVEFTPDSSSAGNSGLKSLKTDGTYIYTAGTYFTGSNYGWYVNARYDGNGSNAWNVTINPSSNTDYLNALVLESSDPSDNSFAYLAGGQSLYDSSNRWRTQKVKLKDVNVIYKPVVGFGNAFDTYETDGDYIDDATEDYEIQMRKNYVNRIDFNISGDTNLTTVTINSDATRLVSSGLGNSDGISTNHTYYLTASLGTGVHICPSALSLDSVNTSCTGVGTFSHSECESDTSKMINGDNVTCSLEGDFYALYNLSNSGVGAGGKLTPEEDQSKIMDNGPGNLSYFLIMKVQWYNESSGEWLDDDIVVNETSPRELDALGIEPLDNIFNNESGLGGGWHTTDNASYGYGTYRVYVEMTDNESNVLQNIDGSYLNETYNFTYFPIEQAPIQGIPVLNATSANNYSSDNLTVYNQSTSDANNDSVKNIINWYRNETSITTLHMPFEGGSNSTFTKDYSGYVGNATVLLNGTAEWSNTSGYDGRGAYYFDGDSGDYIEKNQKILYAYPFTLSAWVKFQSGGGSFVNVVDKDSPDVQYSIHSNGTNAVIWARNGQPVYHIGSTTINDNQWHFVVGVFNSATDRVLYVDGQAESYLFTNYTSVSFNSNVDRFSIGRLGDSTPSNYFNGTIDDVMVFNRSLSAQQVAALYNNRTDLIVSQETSAGEIWKACITPNDGQLDGNLECSNNLTVVATPINITFVPPTPDNGTNTTNTSMIMNVSISYAENVNNIIKNWDGTNYTLYNDSLRLMLNLDNVSALGETSTKAVDVSKSSTNATIYGNAIWNSTGKYNGAYNFDGLNDQMNISITNRGTTPILNETLSAWVYNNGNVSADLQGIITILNSADQNPQTFILFQGSTGLISCGGRGSTTARMIPKTWNHVACAVSFNGTYFSYFLYLNGTLINSTSTALTTYEFNADRIKIGVQKAVSNRFFNGTIDEVRIWNRTLSTDEISKEYNTNLNKYDTNKWMLFENESNLSGGIYDYYACADNYCTDTRTVIIQKESGPCTYDEECTSGYCVEGVCCDSACDSTCESCLAAYNGGSNGTCGYIASGDPYNECSLGSYICSGSGSPNTCSRTRETADCSGTGPYCGSESDNAASGQVCSGGSYVTGTSTLYSSSDSPDRCTSSVPTNGFGDAEYDVFACASGGDPNGPDVGDATNDCGTGCCYDAGSSASCQTSGTHDINYFDFSQSPYFYGDNGATDYCLSSEVLDCYDDTDCLSTHYCDGNICRARPNVTLIYPADEQWFNDTDSIQFNFSVIFGYSGYVDNCSLYTNASGWSLNQTTVGTIYNDTETAFDNLLTFSPGSYLWNVECIGSNGWAQTNRTINIRDPNPALWYDNQTNVTNGTTKYGETVWFSINWTDDSGVKQSIFSWNSSDSGSFTNESPYSCSNDLSCIHNHTINVPITRGEHYCWRFYSEDKYNNVNATDTWCFVAGNSLPVVTLYSPADASSITNRYPTLIWNATDEDNDTLTYDLNLTLVPASLCTDPDLNQSGLAEENYTPSNYLKCLYDNGDYYLWKVRASDDGGSTYTDWTDYWTFNISSEVIISLPTDTINFGSLNISQSKNTTTNDPEPFVIQNDGNCLVNVTTNATELFEAISGASNYYQYKIDNKTGEEGSFLWDATVTDWTQMPIITPVISIADLNWLNATDSAEIDLLVSVPANETPGTKTTTVYFTASLSE